MTSCEELADTGVIPGRKRGPALSRRCDGAPNGARPFAKGRPHRKVRILKDAPLGAPSPRFGDKEKGLRRPRAAQITGAHKHARLEQGRVNTPAWNKGV